MVNPIRVNFDNLAVIVNGKPAIINALGSMKTEDERKWLVVTDVPELEIGKDEYEIFEFFIGDSRVSLQSVEDIELYNELVAMWEETTTVGD